MLDPAGILAWPARRLLAVALLYNGVAVAVCLAGLMTPLRAAVAMPLSSLSLILFTLAALSPRRPRAASSSPALTEVHA